MKWAGGKGTTSGWGCGTTGRRLMRYDGDEAKRCDGVSLFSVDGLTKRPLCDDDGAACADVEDV